MLSKIVLSILCISCQSTSLKSVYWVTLAVRPWFLQANALDVNEKGRSRCCFVSCQFHEVRCGVNYTGNLLLYIIHAHHPTPIFFSVLPVSDSKFPKEAFSISATDDAANTVEEQEDVDECQLYQGQLCQHTCTNTWGSYHCGCHQGYTLQQDGHSCAQGTIINPTRWWNWCGDVVSNRLWCCCYSYQHQWWRQDSQDIPRVLVIVLIHRLQHRNYLLNCKY